MFAGKTLLSPFSRFSATASLFFSLPPFLSFLFFETFFFTILVVSSVFPTRVETSLVARLRGFPPPPSPFQAAAFRLFALLRVNRVATACKTDYALFQLFPLEILDKSLIDLYPLHNLVFVHQPFSRAIVSRNFSRLRANKVFSISLSLFLFSFISKASVFETKEERIDRWRDLFHSVE